MRLFAIDTDDTITAFPAAEQIPEGQIQFASEKELAKLAADWPAERLIEAWNNFAGAVPFDDLKPVKKFTDRKTAVARIWKAIQRLEAHAAPPAAPSAPEAPPATSPATAPPEAPPAREGTKKALVLALLRRPEGATLEELMAATGWQAHSVRGFLSGAVSKKMQLSVASRKRDDGARVYGIAE